MYGYHTINKEYCAFHIYIYIYIYIEVSKDKNLGSMSFRYDTDPSKGN